MTIIVVALRGVLVVMTIIIVTLRGGVLVMTIIIFALNRIPAANELFKNLFARTCAKDI